MNVLRNRRWGTCGACREDVKFQNFVKKVQEFFVWFADYKHHQL